MIVKFRNVGLMEFGASLDHKQAFYQIAKTIITKEIKDVVWAKRLIRCNVKHRGFLRSGNFMTPIFVDLSYSCLIPLSGALPYTQTAQMKFHYCAHNR